MATPSLESVVAELTKLADALEKYLPNTAFTVASKTYSGPETVAHVRSIRDTAARILHLRGELADALRNHRDTQADNAEFLNGLRHRTRASYSNQTTVLAEFGLEPPHPAPPLTNEKLLVRAAKSRATRAKRGTLGKNQKAAIKGKVTGVVITPIVDKGPKGAK